MWNPTAPLVQSTSYTVKMLLLSYWSSKMLVIWHSRVKWVPNQNEYSCDQYFKTRNRDKNWEETELYVSLIVFCIVTVNKFRDGKMIWSNKGYSYLVTQPSTNAAEQSLTLLMGRDAVLTVLVVPESTPNTVVYS